VVAIDLPNARRLVFGVVLGQAAVTLVAALISFMIAGSNAAISALLGGGIGTLASLVMALVSFMGHTGNDARRAVSAFYRGEFVKIVLVIVLFVVVWRSMKVSPIALFMAYLATFFVYWLALANALPSLGGKGAPRDRS
jgi:ATP synthase protein I